MPRNSAIKAEFQKNVHAKSIIFGKKPPIYQLDSNPQPLNASQLHYPLGYLSCGFRKKKLLEFSPLLHLQAAAERRLITALTCSDKLQVGGWWVCGVHKLIQYVDVSKLLAWQTNRRTRFQLYIYISIVPVLCAGIIHNDKQWKLYHLYL